VLTTFIVIIWMVKVQYLHSPVEHYFTECKKSVVHTEFALNFTED